MLDTAHQRYRYACSALVISCNKVLLGGTELAISPSRFLLESESQRICRCSKLRMLSTLPKPDETRMILTVSTEGPQTDTLACGHVDLTPRVVREDNQHSSAHRAPR